MATVVLLDDEADIREEYSDYLQGLGHAVQTVGTIKAMPAKMPGIMPAANSAGTEAPGTNTEYTMKATEGGIKMSVAAAAPTTLAENAAG